MNKGTVIFFGVLVLSLSLNQGFANPEIDDEVIVGFEQESAKAIPDWVNTTMKFYLDGQISEREMLDAFNWLFENNIMHLSPESAQEVQDLRDKLREQDAVISSLRTLVSSQAIADENGEFWFENLRPGYSQTPIGERVMQPEYGADSKTITIVQKFVIELYAETVNSAQGILWLPLEDEEVLIGFEDGDPGRPIIIGRIYNPESSASGDENREFGFNDIPPVESTESSQVSPYQSRGIVMASASDFDLAQNIVNDVLRKGGTVDVWEQGIAAFEQSETTDSVTPELEGIVVLCNNEIDKQTKQIESELKIIEQWLESISEEQELTYDDAGRLTSGAGSESNSQYRETDLEFITRHLASIEQKINALQTGVDVLEEKLSLVGEDAQLSNIDLQNALQKQQQILQTLSNVSKMQHDTAMSIIRKIG